VLFWLNPDKSGAQSYNLFGLCFLAPVRRIYG